MKFSEKWLREWVNPPVSTEGLAAQLTGAGLEVDAWEPVAGPINDVVVGAVLIATPHPNADKLRLCEVDDGSGEPVRVVCGAPNAREGLRAPFAKVGARLPDGTKIRKSKIRGEISHGMLCSAVELGLGDEADGLLELPADAPVGTALTDYLALDDATIDVDLTPNRGDCLGIAGLAREVAVINRLDVVAPELLPVAASSDERFPVRLDAPTDCPRYVGRVIRGIDPHRESPTWLREKLRRCGVRPISPVVDITNYVMLELGQPMHAFDLDSLDREIVVRRAAAGETLTLLDGTELSFDGDALLIADASRPVALAGIMGGLDSGVGDATTNIFLESAWFEPKTISLEARRRGLHTDASHRFERTVSTDLQARAAERATRLVLDIVGGEAGPLVDTCEEGSLPRAAPITLRMSRVTRLLGVALERGEIEDVLSRLGITLDPTSEGWTATPPPYRPDIAIEADLIEEIARIVGFDRLPGEAPPSKLSISAMPEAQADRRRLCATLIDRGYQEAITYSFVDETLQRRLEPEIEAVRLANPISSDLAVMRTTLWTGLLGAVHYNLNRQQSRVRVFETGLVFRPGEGPIDQRPAISGVAAGAAYPKQWGSSAREVDYFDVKGDVEALLRFSAGGGAHGFESAAHPALHPGQSARIVRDGVEIGWIGTLHPEVVSALKLSVRPVLFELDLSSVLRGQLPRFRALSRFPAVRRDLALVVPEEVTAAALESIVGQAGGDMLKNLELFDVYRGEGIDPGTKSLAIGLTFQLESRTLQDEEVEAKLATIMDSLTKNLGARLRG